MRQNTGAVTAAAIASGIVLAIAWLSQSDLAAQLGVPTELRAWAPLLATMIVALIVVPLAFLLLGERRRR